MGKFLTESSYFGLFLSLFSYQFAGWLNKKAGREICSPLLFSTIFCCMALLLTGTEYGEYYTGGAEVLEYFLTPATICLAIPLYRQYKLLKNHARAILAGCVSGVLAHMAGCVLTLMIFQLNEPEYITLLPKSITTAIGRSLSEELGGYPAITMAAIMITGIFGAVMSPSLLKLFRITEPLAQGLAIGASSHAAGTSKAVELGGIQGAASGLAIVVTGLLTVLAAPVFAELARITQ